MRHDADDGRDLASAEFRRLYDDNQDFVWRTLAHFGVAPALLDDALQDVFVVVHRRLSEYDRARPIRSWLWGIARRVAATHQRTSLRVERRSEVFVPGAAQAPADEQVDARRQVSFVESFLGRLPRRYRDVFVLSDIEGASAPEIAETLDVKLGTVYSRLHEARQRFTQAVKRAQGEADR